MSIQALILVPDPFFNEPGYERNRGTPEGSHNGRTQHCTALRTQHSALSTPHSLPAVHGVCAAGTPEGDRQSRSYNEAIREATVKCATTALSAPHRTPHHGTPPRNSTTEPHHGTPPRNPTLEPHPALPPVAHAYHLPCMAGTR
jgi:hypothetical protein